MGGGDGVGEAALVFLALQRGNNLRSVPRILNMSKTQDKVASL